MKSPVNVDPERCWFTSDLHFGHRGILQFEIETRPYEDADEMDEAIIQKWNSQVNPGDIVFCLGDFSFRSMYDTVDIISRLKGKKVMVWGNHDDHLRKKPFQDRLLHHSDYLRQHVPGQDQRLELMHFPIHNWRDQRHGSIHLHGHKHGHPTGVKGKTMDVGWDVEGRLFSWLEIEAKMNLQEKVNHHHD